MNNKNKKRAKHFSYIVMLVLLLGILSSIVYMVDKIHSKNKGNTENKNISHKNTEDKPKNNQDGKNKVEEKKKIEEKKTEEKKADTSTEILLSFAGDCTIGNDPKFSGETLPVVLANKGMDYSYFFKNVSPYFKNDDMTIVNLETTFTNSNNKVQKAFNFKAPPSYVKSLTLGSIEAVNIANNHIYDYNEKGFIDTKETLKGEKINFFGEGTIFKTTIKGKKFAFLGYQGWEGSIDFSKLKTEITELKKEGCIVIINFHWGIERQYHPIEFQKKLAKFSIDNGADLIVGHHPHVVQGIETYKGKYIAYSLGNFCFGGNTNPSDKDTFIMQTNFKFKNDALVETGFKAIPCRISSVTYKNDYCPTPLKENEKNRVLNKINSVSPNSGFKISEEFHYEKH